MKVIIAGGRDFDDYQRLCSVMSKCPYEVTEVVCGGARGADYLGGKWAQIKEYLLNISLLIGRNMVRKQDTFVTQRWGIM